MYVCKFNDVTGIAFKDFVEKSSAELDELLRAGLAAPAWVPAHEGPVPESTPAPPSNRARSSRDRVSSSSSSSSSSS